MQLSFVCFFCWSKITLSPESTVTEEFDPAKTRYLNSRHFSSLYILPSLNKFVINSNNDGLKQIF